eukprot:1388483-Amorphochlora_amoeboformis.AAC.1
MINISNAAHSSNFTEQHRGRFNNNAAVSATYSPALTSLRFHRGNLGTTAEGLFIVRVMSIPQLREKD